MREGKRLVLDASVSAFWMLPDERSQAAESLLEKVLDGGVRLVEPVLWCYENVNLLRTAVLRRRITADTAAKALDLLAEIPVEFVAPSAGIDREILDNALRLDLSAYDAAYVQAALVRGIPLVTEDKDMLKHRAKHPWLTPLSAYLAG